MHMMRGLLAFPGALKMQRPLADFLVSGNILYTNIYKFTTYEYTMMIDPLTLTFILKLKSNFAVVT